MGALLIRNAEINVSLGEGAGDGCRISAGSFNVDTEYSVRHRDQQSAS
jgi:hypothetical protein